MTWAEIRKAFPDQWLVVEALRAHSENGLRVPEDMAVAATCASGLDAWEAQSDLQREHPGREFYPLHTARETIEIREREAPLGRGIRKAG